MVVISWAGVEAGTIAGIRDSRLEHMHDKHAEPV
jgi:hypothetical protein